MNLLKILHQKFFEKISKKDLHFLKRCVIISRHLRASAYAPVAQLDRVTDYESVGRGFESLPVYQNGKYLWVLPIFCFTLFFG